MINLTWFESEKDLQRLTNLYHGSLWNNGFDLDDWDFGIMTDQKLDMHVEDSGDMDCGYYYLIKALNNSAYATREVYFNGKYYYMRYHS